MQDDKFKAARQELINGFLIPLGIRDKKILDVFLKTPRHKFINKKYQKEAYLDMALPIEEGQTISQPSLVAQMTQFLKLKGKERVLEIGTGSGYQAAILSQLANEIYTVVTANTKDFKKYKGIEVLGIYGAPR